MKIVSPAFKNQENIPLAYTCDGANVNPELRFLEVPDQTASLVLIFHDPDAPKEGGWTHWVVFDMEPDSEGVAENSKPSSGVQGTNDFGKQSYGGPCPPNGSHRYIFYLYALDDKLNLDPQATRDEVKAAMEDHILDQATLMGLYERKK